MIITTARSDASSRVSGIRAGADVYLVKPVLPEEFVSLVRNLMRRLRGETPSTWVLDETGWRLFGALRLSAPRNPDPAFAQQGQGNLGCQAANGNRPPAGLRLYGQHPDQDPRLAT